MNRIGHGRLFQRRQRGTTLVVALILILLATLMALFAMNVGIVGQRASANDVRARLVQQTAEGGLSQGIEYFKANFSTAMDATNTALWEKCAADDTSFPCGTVPQCANGMDNGSGCDNDSAGVSSARRSNMYRFIGGGTYDVNGNNSSNDTLDLRSLPFDRLINTSSGIATSATGNVGNNFDVNYGTGALLCMVRQPTAATDPTECTSDPSKASSMKIVTLVSTANIAGENAATTLSMATGTQTSINNPVNAPPVVASGTIDATGNLQIVTNPNSGGTGVPVSIWTRLDAYKTGTPNTCYLDGFIRDQKGNVTIAYEGSKTKIITCDDCTCNASNALSYTSSGNKQQEGIDILDVDTVAQCTTSVTSACKPNLNVQPGEFPCDLFNYVFGVQAWDDSDGDKFCETRKLTTYKAADGVTYTMGADEAYLYEKATFIVPLNDTEAKKAKASQIKTCAQLLDDSVSTTREKGSAYGLVWDQKGCGIGSNKQVATVDNPVVLVEDNTTKIQGRMFGLLFVRPGLYGSDTGPLDPTTGATDSSGADLSTDAGAAIYGSVVVMGQVTKINGTSAIIYQSQVLENLAQEQALNPFAPVPASWTDRFAY